MPTSNPNTNHRPTSDSPRARLDAMRRKAERAGEMGLIALEYDEIARAALDEVEALRNRVEENAALRERVRVLEGALREVDEEIEGYVDIRDGSNGQPRPNNAMRAQGIIVAALAGGTEP